MTKGHRLLSGLASALNALQTPPILIPTRTGQTTKKRDGFKLAFAFGRNLKADSEACKVARVLALNDEIFARFLGAEIGRRLGFGCGGLLGLKKRTQQKDGEKRAHKKNV